MGRRELSLIYRRIIRRSTFVILSLRCLLYIETEMMNNPEAQRDD